MPKLTNEIIEDGYVMGYVKTFIVGSKCTFPICSVEDWEEMTEEEAEGFAFDAMLGSGLVDWGY